MSTIYLGQNTLIQCCHQAGDSDMSDLPIQCKQMKGIGKNFKF